MPTTSSLPVLTTLRWVPPFAVGHVRDLRVRWALEEIGQPYDVRLIGPEEQASPAYRREQPFGQVPVYQDGETTLFESGAILHYLGLQSARLMPQDAAGRTQTLTWLFAASDSVGPPVARLADLGDAAEDDAPLVRAMRAQCEEAAGRKLAGLDQWMAERDYLVGPFTVADILMTTVLTQLDEATLARFPAVHAYHRRCIARPAYGKALADQLALYRDAAP